MVNIVTPNTSAGESVSYGEIAAIESVLKSSFGLLDRTTKPCLDQDHHVSLIDVTGPSAAAIVEFTDCSGASFSDLYVLQKHNNQWAISQKVWDSHAQS